MEMFPGTADDLGYAYSVGRIRVLETRLLTGATFQRLADSESVDEVIRLLGETEYSEVKQGISGDQDFDGILNAELERIYSYVKSFSPYPAVIGFLSMRYDFHNLKVLMKQKLLGQGAPGEALSRIGAVEFAQIEALVEQGIRGKTIPKEYVNAIDEAARVFGERGDPQLINFVIDKWMYKYGFKLAEASESPLLLEFWKASADLANIKNVLRVNRLGRDRRFLENCFLPPGDIPLDSLLQLHMEPVEKVVDSLKFTTYLPVLNEGLLGSDGGLTRFEKLADDYLVNLIKKAKYVSLGVEPLIGYILAKENEVKNLRIIMAGKVNRLKSAAIRERLRDSYV